MKFNGQILSFKKILIASFIFLVLLSIVIYNPLIERWNADPGTYFFFECSFIMCLLFLIKKLINRTIELNIIDKSLIAILVFSIIYELFDHNFIPFNLRDDFISSLAVLCLYLPFRTISKKYPGCLSSIIRLIALIEVCVGLYQIIANALYYLPVIGHLTGTFRNAGVYSIFLSCSTPFFLLDLNARTNGRVYKYTSKVIAAIIMLLVLINLSRTGLLLIIITLLYINRAAAKRAWLQYIKRNFFILFIFCFVSVGFIIMLLCYKYSSVVGRLFVWDISIEMFLKKPLFGYGMSGFERYYLIYQTNYFKLRHLVNPRYKYVATDVVNAFSEYIMLLVRFGLTGFGLLFCLIYKNYKAYKLSGSNNGGCQILVLFLILVSATFYYSFHVTLILVLAIASLAELSVLTPYLKTDYKSPASKRLTLSFLIFFIMGCITYCAIQFRATLIWKAANEPGLQSNSINLFVRAYPDLRHRSNFLFNYGARLYEAGQYENCIKVFEECRTVQTGVDLLLYLGKAYQNSGNYKNAEECFIEASYMVPIKFVPKYYLVQLYIKIGEKDKAFSMGKEILEMPVKIPSEEIEYIKNKMTTLLIKH